MHFIALILSLAAIFLCCNGVWRACHRRPLRRSRLRRRDGDLTLRVREARELNAHAVARMMRRRLQETMGSDADPDRRLQGLLRRRPTINGAVDNEQHCN